MATEPQSTPVSPVMALPTLLRGTSVNYRSTANARFLNGKTDHSVARRHHHPAVPAAYLLCGSFRGRRGFHPSCICMCAQLCSAERMVLPSQHEDRVSVLRQKIGGLKTIRQFCILDMYPSQEIVCLSCEHPIATNSHSYELISCIPFALAFLVCPLIAYNGAILLAVGASVVVILLAVAVYAWLSFARFVNGRDTVKPILFHEDDLSERSIRSSGAHPSHPQVTVVF